MHAYRRARGDALRGRSLEHYSQIERYVGDWMNRPLTEITRERVEHRHKEIAARVVESHRAANAARAKELRARACGAARPRPCAGKTWTSKVGSSAFRRRERSRGGSSTYH